MVPGRVVYFWFGGPPRGRGLYGWGTIVDRPVAGKDGYWVEIKYEISFPRLHGEHPEIPEHISYTALLDNAQLRKHLLFRMPIGTNFVLSDADDQAMRAIIATHVGSSFVPPAHAGNLNTRGRHGQ